MPLQKPTEHKLLDLPKNYEYDLPPPNDGCHDLRCLRFGRSDYEQERNNPKDDRYYFTNDNGHRFLRRDWRKQLPSPDPWAYQLIYLDFTGKFLIEPHKLYLAMNVFDPDLLEVMLIRHPRVIQLVLDISKKGFRSEYFRPLQSFLPRFFRTDYKTAYKTWWEKKLLDNPGHVDYNARVYQPHTFEDVFKQACLQFDEAAPIVAKFLARHFSIYHEHWTPLLAQHADMSEYWKLFTTPELRVKPKIQVIKKDRSNRPPLPQFITQGVPSGNPDASTSTGRPAEPARPIQPEAAFEFRRADS